MKPEDVMGHPLYFLGFLTIHGLLFLGGGYFISFTDPGFALMHSGLGILVYTIFFLKLYPKHARSALLGSAISVGIGLYFGDYIMDSLYSDIELTTLHKIYAAMLTLYIYLYIDMAYNIIKDFIQKKPVGVR